MEELFMRNYSSIQVSGETKSRLKALALTPNESFENIILRLLDAKLNGREIKYIIRNIDSDCNIEASVDWGLEKENILFFDKDGDRKFDVPEYEFEDKIFQSKWNDFVRDINNLENLVNILSILEYGEEIKAGNLVLSRIN